MNRILILLLLCTMSTVALAQAAIPEPKQDEKSARWGYINSATGKWVVKPAFTSAEAFLKGPDNKYRALVTKGVLQGYLGPDGKPLGVGVVFESIEPVMAGDNKIVTVKGKKGIINPDGAYVQKPEISEIKPLGAEGYFVTVKGKQGFVSPEGNTVVPPLYTSIDPSEEGYFIVNKDGKAGILTRDGNVVLEPGKFTGVKKFGEYWKIMKGNKIGLFNATNKAVILEPNYADILEPVSYSGGMAFPVKKNNDKWGAVNNRGKELIKFKNQEMTPLGAIRAIRIRRNRVGGRLYMLDKGLFLELDSWSDNNVGPFRVVALSVATPSQDTPPDMVVGLSFSEHVQYSGNYEQRKSVYKGLPGKSFKVITDTKGNALDNDAYDILPLGLDWLAVSNTRPWVVYDRDGNPKVQTSMNGAVAGYSPNQGWYTDSRQVIFPDLKTYPIKICNNSLQFIDKDGNGSWVPMLNDTPQFGSPAYDDVVSRDSLHVFVKRGDLWGMFIGDREVFKPEFNAVRDSQREEYLEVEKDGAIGLYNVPDSKWIIPLSLKVKQYEFYNKNADSPILVSNGKWGLVSANGDILEPMTKEKANILESLKPKKVEPKKAEPVKKTTPKQPKSNPKPAKSDTQFQESNQSRRF